METESMQNAQARRPVRVTIEGHLCSATKRRNVLTFSGGSLILRADLPDVVVEELPSGRTWTDGDVVVSAGATVWYRRDGRWHSWDGSSGFDPDMDGLLAEGAELLRYQAGVA